MDRVVRLVIGAVLLAVLGMFLSWAATELNVPEVLRRIGLVLFVLCVLVAVVGLFGYGPGKNL